MNIIPANIITEITGATDSTEIARQGEAIIQTIENYLGILLVKKDIIDEKITINYPYSRIFKPKFAPINTISSLSVITYDGEYKAKTLALSIGKYTIEILPRFWYNLSANAHTRILPDAVSAVKISYNAGYFSSWSELPAILQQVAMDLLKYKYASGSDFNVGFQSEHLGDYSYTKGNIVRGIPAEIATILDNIQL